MSLSADVKLLNSSGTLVLDLATSAGWTIEAWDDGTRAWRRVSVTAEDVPGEVETQAVLDVQKVTVQVRASAASWAAVQTMKAALESAVSSRTWQLQIILNSVTYTWTCTGPADIVTVVDRGFANINIRRISFSAPCNPYPVVT